MCDKTKALFADIQTLNGIGEKTRPLFQKLLGSKVKDIIYHLPVSVIDRRNMPAISDMENGQIITTIVTVDQHIGSHKPQDKSAPYKVLCSNETGFISLVYFNAYPRYLRGILPIGSKKVISGKIDKFNGATQMMHPDYIENVEKIKNITKVEPIYPLTYGISQKLISKSVINALSKIEELDEWISEDLMKKYSWHSWKKSIELAHNPSNIEDISSESNARKRLAYDELLANQLALSINRKFSSNNKGVSVKGSGFYRSKLLKELPFELTDSQKDVIKEINADQESNKKMVRLLQGDVGSGKTVVALIAALNAVETKMQVAIMAPTEILANQHYKWINEYSEKIGLHTKLLIGKTKAKDRKEILKNLSDRKINILIGTHALFQDEVVFQNLGFVVIDEQHRFGVKQRNSLVQKGENTDLLLMSATPIPRTLTMTLYGDMECSQIKSKPKGRQPIETKIVSTSKIQDILRGIQRVIDKKEKIYWICPLIEESENIDLVAVENRFQDLKRFFGKSVGLLHGKMKAEERERIMLEFRDGEIDILVATTVVEVGVDVSDATAIIIEHAERFGLSQLHQLRGRVGRNDKKSSCILLYHKLGDISKERLKIMRESDDGFYLAEQDLRLRGGGDLMGTKQSGMPDFKVADLFYHIDLLKIANLEAKRILNDSDEKGKLNKNILNLLKIFGYSKQSAFL